MSIFAWIILGLISGFVASKIVDRSGEGFILDIALGIVGAIVGGLWSAARGKTGVRAMIRTSFVFGVAMSFAALAPVLAVAIIALALVGFASVSFLSMANSTLQLGTDPQMRGRVMALWAVAFMGSTPIGGPLIGWITSEAGARVGLGVGAASCFVAALIGWLTVRHFRSREATQSNVVVSPSNRAVVEELRQSITAPYDGQELDS